MRELVREHASDPLMVVVGGRGCLSQNNPDESGLTDAGPSLPDRVFFLVSDLGTIEDCEAEQPAPLLSLRVVNVSVVGDLSPSSFLFLSPC